MFGRENVCIIKKKMFWWLIGGGAMLLLIGIFLMLYAQFWLAAIFLVLGAVLLARII